MNHKILTDFEIQTDYRITARKPDIMLSNKKILNILIYLTRYTEAMPWMVEQKIFCEDILRNSSVAKIWTNSDRLILEPWWRYWVFGLESWAQMMRNRWYTLFMMSVSLTVFIILKNLTPIWKCVEIELVSVFCLNNVERIFFVIYLHIKDLLHRST